MPAHTSIPSLAPTAIHLWYLSLTADEDNEYFLDCLNPDERRRAERFLVQAARDSFVRTRGRLRILLGYYLSCAPQAIEFIQNSHGKPRLADTQENQGLVFNISHSGEYAVLAFAHDIALGVDIELPRSRLDLDGLADFCLAPEEREWWRTLPTDERLSEFLRLWVSKEAFVKAAGRGIALGLSKVCISHSGTGFASIPAAYGSVKDWHLTTWEYHRHRVALAYRGSSCGISIFA